MFKDVHASENSIEINSKELEGADKQSELNAPTLEELRSRFEKYYNLDEKAFPATQADASDQRTVESNDPDVVTLDDGTVVRLPETKDNSAETSTGDVQNNGEVSSEELKPTRELTDAEKGKIQEVTDWSDEIVNSIHSPEEAEIYINANLKEMEINGENCLIRNDINMEQKDELGRTNKERMENGIPPLTKNGETVELHHIGQKSDGPLAELTTQEHRGKGNDTILHDKQKESEINRNEFMKEREDHWQFLAENFK